MTATTFELRADATEVLAFIEALSADLANAPHELRKLCLDFINSGTDLVRVEDCITSGTVVTALLKPTQRFLDFGLAIRTGNFNDIVIERAHDEPPVIVVSETSNAELCGSPKRSAGESERAPGYAAGAKKKGQ